MKVLIDTSKIEFAVVGESMAGKTTWITSLFKENVNLVLREQCLDNSEGQTKIKTCYKLVDSGKDSIDIEYVEVANKVLEEILKDDKKKKELEYLLGYIEGCFDNDGNEAECAEFVRVDLSGKGIDIIDFFKNVINNKAIAEMDVVSHICISAPAHETVYDTMKSLGLETVIIWDTRGLLDETDSFYEKRKKLQDRSDKKNKDVENKDAENAENDLMALLADRGVLDADGCVFVTSGGSALKTRENRQRYGFLFQAILDSMPAFLLACTPGLTYLMGMGMEEEFNLGLYKKWMEVDKSYKFIGPCARESICNAYLNLFRDHGLFGRHDGWKAMVIERHYRQLLLPFIQLDCEDQRKEYIMVAHAAFAIIAEGLCGYKKNLGRMQNDETGLMARLKETFSKGFEKIFEKSRYMREDGKYDTVLLKKEFVEDVANQCVAPEYYGGLVGVRGGITTHINGYGKTGKCAIDLLEAAYTQFNKLIEESVKNSSVDDETKAIIYEYLKSICNKHAFAYACTDPMFQQSFLRNAWAWMRERNDIDKELRYDYTNAKALLIVREMLGHILIDVLGTADDNK